MSEEERKARNMRENVGIKDWIAQSKDGSTHSPSRQRTVCFSICLVKTRPQTWPSGNDKMVNCWTKECGRQNTKDTSKLTGSLVSIESICEIAHSDNSEVTS